MPSFNTKQQPSINNWGAFIRVQMLVISSVLFFLTTTSAQTDSLPWLSFRAQVMGFHPAMRNAALVQNKLEAQLFSAKGGFDVKTFVDYEEKTFNQKNYFRYLETGVKWPTWYGLEFKTAYNRASGDYISAERTLPQNGQAVFGVEWTLLQGLMIDERRANLKIAKAGMALGFWERKKVENNLSYEAAQAYCAWVLADNQLKVIENALLQARLRHEGLTVRFLQGESPAIDTLETFIQWQSRQIDLSLAILDRKNALQQMQIYQWPESKTTQLRISDRTDAPTLEQLAFLPEKTVLKPSDLLADALKNHPDLAIYRTKAEQLEIEQALKREGLKPVLNANYNILGNGWSFFPTPTENGVAVLANDIKWGVHFSMPITNRKARGSVDLANIKVVENQWSIYQKQQEIENKVLQYYNDLTTLRTQLSLLQNITTNYRALLDGENEKFILGESSVFLVNTREQRWLDAQLKYLKLLSEYRKAEAGLLWAMGAF